MPWREVSQNDILSKDSGRRDQVDSHHAERHDHGETDLRAHPDIERDDEGDGNDRQEEIGQGIDNC